MEPEKHSNPPRVAAKVKAARNRFHTFLRANFAFDDLWYNVNYPVIGLVMSMLSAHFFGLSVASGMGWGYRMDAGVLPCLSYVVVAGMAACWLHKGLSKADYKALSWWLLLKGVEVAATLYGIVYFIYDNYKHFYGGWILSFGIIVNGINVVMFFHTYKYRSFLKSPRSENRAEDPPGYEVIELP